MKKAIKTDLENDTENRRGHQIAVEHLVSGNPNLAVNMGEIILIIGYSECGMGILFNWLAKIDTSTSNSILIVRTLVECNTKK